MIYTILITAKHGVWITSSILCKNGLFSYDPANVVKGKLLQSTTIYDKGYLSREEADELVLESHERVSGLTNNR